jgi:hypothetical protein
MIRRARVLAFAVAFGCGALVFTGRPTAAAQAGAAVANPILAGLLAQLAAEPTVPAKYSANVLLHVRLRIFPWISVTLRGTEAYKHPGFYHFIFTGVPKAAEHFSDLSYDLGNASAWPTRYNIALLTAPSPGVDPVIELVPKKHGMVKTLDVTVDSAKGHMLKAVWSRYDGGIITLFQYYNSLGTREVVERQDATIRIPHMSADLTATYDNFTI